MEQLYIAYKLGQKLKPAVNAIPEVCDGVIFNGRPVTLASLAPRSMIAPSEAETPVIGFPVLIGSLRMDDGCVRTSAIRSYYKHCDTGEHPDKLVLPSEFPKEDLAVIKLPEMKEGDYLLATSNSIYYLEKYEQKESDHESSEAIQSIQPGDESVSP